MWMLQLLIQKVIRLDSTKLENKTKRHRQMDSQIQLLVNVELLMILIEHILMFPLHFILIIENYYGKANKFLFD